MLLHRFKECLLPGLQDSTQLLKQQFKKHGQTFGFQLFKQIHNITTKFINNVQTGRKLTRYSLNFDEIIHRLSTNNFYMPNIAASQASNASSGHQKKKRGKTKTPIGEGKGPWKYTEKKGQYYKYFGKEYCSRQNPLPPTNDKGKRLCFHAMQYKKCMVKNCPYSHKIRENEVKIVEWVNRNNIPLSKRA